MKTLVGGQMPRIRSGQSRRFGWGFLFFQNRRGWNNNDPSLRNINGGTGLGEGARQGYLDDTSTCRTTAATPTR